MIVLTLTYTFEVTGNTIKEMLAMADERAVEILGEHAKVYSFDARPGILPIHKKLVATVTAEDKRVK